MNKYESLSKTELIEYIEEMEEVIKQMGEDKDDNEFLSFPWIGNLGQWNWMVQSNRLVFNEKKATNLGYSSEEIPVDAGFEYFTTKLHPDDYEKTMMNMRQHLRGLSNAFEVKYRIRKKDGSYAWYYDRGTVTKRNKAGDALVMSGIVFDISRDKKIEEDLKEANKKLRRLAITDELTGAFNKRYMIEKIQENIDLYDRTNSCFSIMMVDIDRFKAINDTYGHNMGDHVLQKIAEVILQRIRKTDILARWGGDELIILLPNTQLEAALKVAEDIRAKTSNLLIKNGPSITISIGVSDNIGCDCIDTVVERADNFMYRAKSAGRNSVQYQQDIDL